MFGGGTSGCWFTDLVGFWLGLVLDLDLGLGCFYGLGLIFVLLLVFDFCGC